MDWEDFFLAPRLVGRSRRSAPRRFARSPGADRGAFLARRGAEVGASPRRFLALGAGSGSGSGLALGAGAATGVAETAVPHSLQNLSCSPRATPQLWQCMVFTSTCIHEIQPAKYEGSRTSSTVRREPPSRRGRPKSAGDEPEGGETALPRWPSIPWPGRNGRVLTRRRAPQNFPRKPGPLCPPKRLKIHFIGGFSAVQAPSFGFCGQTTRT